MNFIKAKISEDGATLHATGLDLPVASSLRSATDANRGKDVVIGVRPENVVQFADRARGETVPIRVEVEISEPLGHEVIVHARIGDALLVCPLDSHSIPKPGDPLDLLIEADAIHLFDAKTELRLGA